MTSILKADNIQDADGNNIINENSNTITIGASGDTITIPSGATITNSGTATGFGGITMVDTWRLTTTFTGDANPITSNLERVDAPAGYGSIGSAMTESSGIFTFPSTGIYLIHGMFGFLVASGQTDTGHNGRIQVTTNNSDYNPGFLTRGSGSASEYQSASGFFVFDVTDTSTHKARIRVGHNNSASSNMGSTSRNETAVTFIRLGDT